MDLVVGRSAPLGRAAVVLFNMATNERSAGFIIFRRAAQAPEFLLLDYGRHWDLPKGHVNKGESDLDAALRELKEETAIDDVRVVPNFQHEIVYFFRKRALVRKTVVFFLGETDSAEVKLSHEHVGYEYLPFEAAMKRITYPNARQVLQAANARLTDISASSADTMS